MMVRMAWVGLIGVESYLLVDEALPLAGVPVGQVERVAGKLDTTGALALGEVRVVAACGCKKIESAHEFFQSNAHMLPACLPSSLPVHAPHA